MKRVYLAGTRKLTLKRSLRATGRGSLSASPARFREWGLYTDEGDRYVYLVHTHAVRPWETPPEEPAGVVHVVVRATEEEQKQYGAWRRCTLKRRFASVKGDTDGAQVALEAGVAAYVKQTALRESA
jgi:hypothetical protein